jgi:hypothetical protein
MAESSICNPTLLDFPALPVFLRKMVGTLARAKNVFYLYDVKRLLPNSRDTSI